MSDINQLEIKMKAVMAQAKECVDFSMDIIEKDPDTKKVICKHWENFLVHFFDYVKSSEKESGQDILKFISLRSLMKFL